MHRRLATRWLRPLTILTVMLMLSGMILSPAIIAAQDAATPIAVLDEVPTPTPVADQDAPTPGPTEEPTEAPTAAPVITDSVAPIENPFSLAAGASVSVSVDYLISTSRLSTDIHAELRLPDDEVATGWGLSMNDTAGAGQVDFSDAAVEAGASTLTFVVTAPSDALAGDTVTLHISSIVDLGDGLGTVISALDGLAPLATVVVAPTDAPTEVATEPTVDNGTPIAVEPTETPVENASPIAEPTEQPVDSGTPVAAEPTQTPAPVVIDIPAEFQLQDRAVTKTVILGESGVATVNYLYTVTADRLSITIHAGMYNDEGQAAPGWTVSLNGAGQTLIDGEHVSSGSTFAVSVKVTADKTVAPRSIARLRFDVTIASPGVGPAQAALSGIHALLLLDESDPAQTATVNGPVFKAAGGVSTNSVTPTGSLTCTGQSNAYGPNGDGAVPGQVLHYHCDLPGSLLATLSGSVSMTVVGTAGWQFRIHYSVRIATLDTLIDSGWTTTTQSLSGLTLLSTTPIYVDLRAPSVTLTPSTGIPDFRAQVNITATTSSVTCLGVCDTGTAVIKAYAAFTATSSDGGALLNLIPGALGIPVGTVLFDIECTPSSLTIVPVGRSAINCAMYTILDVSLLSLLGVATIGANITVSATSNIQSVAIAAGWNTVYTGQTASLLSISAQPVAGVGILNFSKFTVFINAGGSCSTPIATGALDSVFIGAAYSLTVLNTIAVPLSSGISAVPVKVEGSSITALPQVAVNSIDFGSFTYTGSGYTPASSNKTMTITLSAPSTTLCVTSPWKVTAAYAALSGFSDAGHATALTPATAIPVSAITYVGAATGGTGTIVPVGSPSTPSTSAVTLINGTDQLAVPAPIAFTLKLTPPSSQRPGFYQGSVTVTTAVGP